MFYFKVILISLVILSTVQAADKCGAPKHYFSIDRYGATDCGSSCEATVIFSGYREDNAEYVTIDMITDNFEPNKFMTLEIWYDNEFHNLTCSSESFYRNMDYNGLQCNWQLQLTNYIKNPITNVSILSYLLLNDQITNDIYFGLNGDRTLVASSLTHLIPYHESFPDCTEYDVITFYDPRRLNKIVLSKKKDSITGFIYSLGNEQYFADRSIEFTDSDEIKFTVICADSAGSQTRYLTRYGWNDWNVDVIWPKFTKLPGKCGFSVPLKIYSDQSRYYFDFNKRPINMVFTTTQPNASFDQSDIKFKSD
uniref:CUB domain-containing protein n=1 Tax=Tetranychus urticae TaxID=32264 RepID=T1JSD0_TETUR